VTEPAATRHEPPPAALAWALAAVGPGTTVDHVAAPPQQRPTGPWLLHLRTATGGTSRAVLHVADPADADGPRRFRTVAAALRLAEQHALAAPRLLGHADDEVLALLQSALDGDSRIPRNPPLDRARNFGRALAAIHAIALEPTDDLPRRRRSLETVDFDALPPPADPTDADRVDRIRRATDEHPLPPIDQLVHGDLWQGNALWTGPQRTEHLGTIDWDQAGVGHPAIDLGTTRFDAAVFHGPDHADALLLGWRDARGTDDLDDPTVAVGDLLAVRCSPPDLDQWLPNFHAQGRTDLTLDEVTRRRDAFVEAALRNLDK
jgi:aminoglycoside phosphotransferase